MSALQAILLAILQGVTELFPVSSLGHGVILPRLLGWAVDQRSPEFLPFLVVLHVGTAAALLVYFWRDWLELLLAVLGRGAPEERSDALHLLVLLVAGTLPAVIIGFLLEHFLRNLFGAPLVAAIFLIVNGGLLFVGERLRRRAVGERGLDELGWLGAVFIGVLQCTALIPGISRSGATMVGGLLAGLRHDQAARFSFLLATPIIAGAAVLEVPKLLKAAPGGAGLGSVAIVAGIVAGVTAYASVAFLMRYFKRHEIEALDPFAWYCWAAGALAIVLLQFVA
jgi:undecaprenyl-diphosphatase